MTINKQSCQGKLRHVEKKKKLKIRNHCYGTPSYINLRCCKMSNKKEMEIFLKIMRTIEDKNKSRLTRSDNPDKFICNAMCYLVTNMKMQRGSH